MHHRHILIANNVYPPIMAGGAELIVAYQAEELARRGHRVTIVSTCGPEMEPYPVETRNGVTVIRFFPHNLYWSFTRGEKPGYQKALWHLRDAWNRDASRKFQDILSKKRPNLLHTHLIDGMSAVLWRRAKQSGIPVLHTAHDYHLLCPRAFMLTRSMALCTKPQLGCHIYRRWHLRTSRDVDLFCSPSQFLINKHLENGLQAKATAVVPNGIPLPQITLGAPRSPNAPLRFLFPARLTVEKGCNIVLEAMKYLPPELNFNLTVVGKGVLEEQFRVAAQKDKRLHFLGYVSGTEKDQIFRTSDCLLIPSIWYENAPVVIVEAAAYGMGVIGSRIGAIPEFVQDRETGLLFEPGNAQALAGAMQELIHNPARLDQFATNARNLLSRSTVAAMVTNYESHYDNLLSSAQHPAR